MARSSSIAAILVHNHFPENRPFVARFARIGSGHARLELEKLAIGGRALYIDVSEGVRSAKLTAAFMEKRLGCRGMARIVRSLVRILAKMR